MAANTPTKSPKTDRRELTESERYRIIGRWEAGQTVGEIGRKVGRPTSTIARLVKKFSQTGQVKNMPGRGAKQKRGKKGDKLEDDAKEVDESMIVENGEQEQSKEEQQSKPNDESQPKASGST